MSHFRFKKEVEIKTEYKNNNEFNGGVTTHFQNFESISCIIFREIVTKYHHNI